MNYLNAFWVGGLICVLCQVLIDKTKLTPARVLVSLVVLGVILQGLAIEVVKNNTPARNPPSERERFCSQFFLYPITQITVITMAHTTAAALTVRTLLTTPSACCRSSLNSHAGRK